MTPTRYSSLIAWVIDSLTEAHRKSLAHPTAPGEALDRARILTLVEDYITEYEQMGKER